MKKLFFITLIVWSAGIPAGLFSQNNWQWGYQGTNDNYCATEIGTVDNLNNIYSIFPYDSTLILSDTMFHHSGNFIYHPNFAIVKFNSEGYFLNALDFHVQQNGYLFERYITVDNDFNLYVLVRFLNAFTVNGFVIYPKSSAGDVVLLKFDSNFNLMWKKYIYSASADYCHGLFLTKENNIFLYTRHENNGYQQYKVNFLDQDSAYFKNSIISFLDIDSDGNIIWRKEFRSTGPELFGGESFLGEDKNIYAIGLTEDTIFIDADTVLLPSPATHQSYAFLVKIKPDGSIQRVFISEKGVFYPGHVDSENNYYFNMFVYDTLVLGNDTLISSNGDYFSVFGKTDSLYNVIWYKKIRFPLLTGYSFTFYTDLKNDTLYFGTNCFGSFEFADSSYNLSNNSNILYGKCSSEGTLTALNIASASSKVIMRDIALDNCNNFYISGYFHGNFITGNDTLVQEIPSFDDGFIAKITGFEVVSINIGADTTISLTDTLVLSVPAYFTNILWSTGDTTASITLLGSQLQQGVHTVWVKAYQGGCIATDTVTVTVIDNSGIPDREDGPFICYPNPARQSLHFYSKSGLPVERITIFNQTGKVVLQRQYPGGKIDLTNLGNGIYFVEFESNRKYYRQKIAVMR